MKIETYMRPDASRLVCDAWKQPFCFNGMVGVRRYLITYEEIPEPVEVLVARIQALRDGEDGKNSHSWGPLEREANSLGYTMDCNTRKYRPFTEAEILERSKPKKSRRKR